MEKKRVKINNVSLLIAVALLVVMYIAGANIYERFGSVSTILNLFNDNAYLIVVSVGMTFVLLTGGIDISVASTLAFSGVFSAFLLEKGWSAGVVIPLVLLIGAFVGYMQGYVIHTFDIAPFLVTLAGQFLMRGMCAVISTVSIPINNGFYKAVALGKISFTLKSGGRPKLYYYVFVAVFVVLAAWYVLKYTRFGRAVYAVGSNEQSAQYMGLNVKLVKIGVYAINGFCAALGGVLFSFYTLAGYSLQNMGLELDAISSAVIGGTLLTGGVGTVIGSLVGVLIQGIIQTIVTYQNLNTWWTKVNELYVEKQYRLEAQLKSLQEQIKPHFLYNTLDTISWLAREHGAMDVVGLVDALTNMFRVGLSSGRDFIMLREEKKHVVNYLYIQKVRYGERLQYEIKIPNEYDEIPVPKLILQPLVENAIYHGVKKKRTTGRIEIDAFREGQKIYIRIRDDGAGISPGRLAEIREWLEHPGNRERGEGFGLSYMGERIELTYGLEYGSFGNM